MYRNMLATGLLLTLIAVQSAVAQGSITAWGNNSAGRRDVSVSNADVVVVAGGPDSSLGVRGSAPAAVTFTDIVAGLPGVRVVGTVGWGDYDNDGDLDLLITGDTSAEFIARVYRNDAGTFTDIAAGLPGVSPGWAEWGDFDNDGDLDLALAGNTGTGFIAGVYRNDAGTFTDAGAGLPGASGGLAWGDYDNDGDLDLALTGNTGAGFIARVYHNDAGAFTDIGAGLSGVNGGSAVWGDYDDDGDLDLVLTGDAGAGFIARVYRNDAGAFTDIVAGLPGSYRGRAAWGDYDNDGDLDLALVGDSGAGFIAGVYRNDAGTFTDIAAGLPGVYRGRAAWGDYDNDGDLDLALTGETPGGFIARVYRNDAGTFTDVIAGLPGVAASYAAWGDYDNDGDLDLALTGSTAAEYIARIYRSDGAPANTVPSAPSGLSASVVGNQATLSWTAASDAQTPAAGLSYNLRIGTTPGGNEISSAMSDGTSGYQRVVALGNAQQRTSWTVTVPPGSIYWSVQAVDGAWAGSAFAAEQSFGVIGFTDIAAGLPGVFRAWSAWGDYDNDGDLDLLLTGNTGTGFIARVYRNDAGTFTDIAAGLLGVYRSRSAWGDYDNDGDLDLVLTGDTGTELLARIYRNEAGTFTDIGAGLPGVGYGAVAWGDYDNDGDLDLLLTGDSGGVGITRVYRNSTGMFADIGAGLPQSVSAAAWGDYDNDGDLDLVLAGQAGAENFARVYRNDAGTFTDIGAGLQGAYQRSAVAWGDYDSDGDLDLVLMGDTGTDCIAYVYRNDGGVFANTGAGLPGVDLGSVSWGDYDNDGDLDLVLAGDTGSGYIARVYRNDAGAFTDIGAGLPGVSQGPATWADCDNDGDLDLLLAGNTGVGYIARIYRSEGAPANTVPSAPSGLSASASGDWATFGWSAAGDAQTPSVGLSYNLRIGATPGGDELCTAMASGTGYRRVPQLGNMNQTFSRRVPASAFRSAGSAHWSAQAIDGAWAGSAFAAEQGFTLAPRIQSVTDVPADQGGKVRLTIAAAPYDHVNEALRPVASYNVWQRIDDPATVAMLEERGIRIEPGTARAASPGGQSGAEPLVLPSDIALTEWGGRYFALDRSSASASPAATVAATDAGAANATTFPAGTWELVGNFAAAQLSQYTYRATTVVDSPAVSAYIVSAHTTLPSLWFLSDPDSGRSVDDIAPGVPRGFAATLAGLAVDLSWQASEAEDFQYFRIYRGAMPDFPAGPASLVHSTATLAWTDASPDTGTIHYKLTAVDHSGNESAPASASVDLTVSVDRPVAPAAFALLGATPNPFFNVTAIPFEVQAGGGAVRLEVYDLSGGLVRTLLVGPQSPGQHLVSWDGRDGHGRRLSAGIYFYRMQARGFAQTRKLVLAR